MAPRSQDERENASVKPGEPVTVLTVDDQDYFRAVMRELVRATAGFRLVGEVASGEDALEAVEALSPALVIIDNRMAGMGGLEATRRMCERHPELVVVVTSIEDPNPAVMEAYRAAFVRKQDLSPRLLHEVWRHREARG
jgi:two-component system, NarL family, invasion response regulator UvrY